MESSRSSTERIWTTSSNVVETFVSLPFVETTKDWIDLLVYKEDIVYNFLRIPQNTFQMLQSTFQIESNPSSTQTIWTTSSIVVETFV